MLTGLCPMWLHRKTLLLSDSHTHPNTHLPASFLRAAEIGRCMKSRWSYFQREKFNDLRLFLNLTPSRICQTQTLHNYNHYGVRQQTFTAAALDRTENGQTQFPLNDSRNICVLPLRETVSRQTEADLSRPRQKHFCCQEESAAASPDDFPFE